jgi:hypothetical protein
MKMEDTTILNVYPKNKVPGKPKPTRKDGILTKRLKGI